MNDDALTPAIPRLHDALLQSLEIDWVAGELHLCVRVAVDDDQRFDQLARITVTGLRYCRVDSPIYKDAVEKTRGKGLWIDDGPGVPRTVDIDLPEVPAGCFRRWIFVHAWNSFIHFAGSGTRSVWLEQSPVAISR